MASIRRGERILCEDFHGNLRDGNLLPYNKSRVMDQSSVQKYHVR